MKLSSALASVIALTAGHMPQAQHGYQERGVACQSDAHQISI
jgi:hypothetical protein